MSEILIWAPDRAAFEAAMKALRLPDGTRPARDDGEGGIVAADGLRVDEIGRIEKIPAVIDDDTGEETTPAVFAPGHHVNLWIVEPLWSRLDAALPLIDASPGERLAASGLLGVTTREERGPRGEPAGWAFGSGLRVVDPAAIDRRRRVWT